MDLSDAYFRSKITIIPLFIWFLSALHLFFSNSSIQEIVNNETKTNIVTIIFIAVNIISSLVLIISVLVLLHFDHKNKNKSMIQVMRESNRKRELKKAKKQLKNQE